jgi:2-polyprenyl-3-methyl-5-hydroxy-6-metoxy-1,4-benzoquinol methylase
MSMPEPYEPRNYWEGRLSSNFNLRGVGHICYTEDYNAWLYRRKADTLSAALDGSSVSGQSVLDVGCGTGFFVRSFVGRGALVHGVDITDVSIARLQAEFPRHAFTTASISSPMFVPPGTFEIVNIWDVLYHVVDDEDFRTALGNLASCVRPGGQLLLTDQLAGSADAQVAPHVKLRCLATYQSVLPDLGLHLVKLLPLYFRLNDMKQPDQETNAAEYYASDVKDGWIARNNLSVGVWRSPEIQQNRV